ncbi:MAG: Ku protein, partial [Actinomycetota bacterium]|nr:Ku protein [Actinomycetota bacterium]
MARAIWSGSINLGLVSIPVAMYSATEDHTVHFHQFQRGTADRIRYQRINERTGKEVDYADIVKGAEVGGGDYVIVEPEELDAIAPGRSRTIDITRFVDLDKIDPVYFQKTYWLAPTAEQYARPYALLR